MKKLICILTLLLALVCVLAACESDDGATEAEPPEGLEFFPLPDGTYGVSAGKAFYLEDVVIPSTYKGTAVTQVFPEAFHSASNLKTITIPNSITVIGDSAFGNSGLVSVTFEEDSQLTTIDRSAFIACRSLTSITLPASVSNIGNDQFMHCESLTTITFAEGSQLTKLGAGAFQFCSSLNSITIPAGVINIEAGTFYECGSLTSVTFAEGSQLAKIDTYAFNGCSSLTDITIPAKVTDIGDDAFYGCNSLTSVTFAEPNGWIRAGTPLSATDLADPATAATYLKSTYCGNTWTRTAND